jgi:hypothetical protein
MESSKIVVWKANVEVINSFEIENVLSKEISDCLIPLDVEGDPVKLPAIS